MVFFFFGERGRLCLFLCVLVRSGCACVVDLSRGPLAARRALARTRDLPLARHALGLPIFGRPGLREITGSTAAQLLISAAFAFAVFSIAAMSEWPVAEQSC